MKEENKINAPLWFDVENIRDTTQQKFNLICTGCGLM